jgi:hypothetical protein
MTTKPSHVFDRDREWRALDSFAFDPRGQATLGVVSGRRRQGKTYLVASRRRESHPPPLSEPCLTVSRYTAPAVEPVGNAPCFQCANMPG